MKHLILRFLESSSINKLLFLNFKWKYSIDINKATLSFVTDRRLSGPIRFEDAESAATRSCSSHRHLYHTPTQPHILCGSRPGLHTVTCPTVTFRTAACPTVTIPTISSREKLLQTWGLDSLGYYVDLASKCSKLSAEKMIGKFNSKPKN